jgi:hypothetical protein
MSSSSGMGAGMSSPPPPPAAPPDPPRPAARAVTAAAAPEELDALGDHLGDVALLAFLVVVLAAPDRALDEDLAALVQVLAAALGLLSPDDDVVPFRPFLALAFLRGPLLGGRDREARDGAAARREAELRILAEVTDQHHFVQRHRRTSVCARDHSRASAEGQRAGVHCPGTFRRRRSR